MEVVYMGLTEPSRRIIVEPIEVPVAPAPRPERKPVKTPQTSPGRTIQPGRKRESAVTP
jgi:hypothetical protein